MNPALLLFIGLTLVSCNTGTPIESIADDEYAIYSLILNSRENEEKKNTVIFYKTIEPLLTPEYVFENLDETIREDFAIKSRKPYVIKNRFVLNGKYNLLTCNVADEDFEKYLDSLKKFHEMFPNTHGFYEFTRAGFNRDANQAVVYVNYQCPALCGSGYFYLLRKENEIWKLEKAEMVWIS